jgi:hypothetical protein
VAFFAPIYDIYPLITEAIPNFLLDEAHSGVSRWLLEISGWFNKAGKINMDKFAWQSGKGSLLEAVRVTEGEPLDVGTAPKDITQRVRLAEGT